MFTVRRHLSATQVKEYTLECSLRGALKSYATALRLGVAIQRPSDGSVFCLYRNGELLRNDILDAGYMRQVKAQVNICEFFKPPQCH